MTTRVIAMAALICAFAIPRIAAADDAAEKLLGEGRALMDAGDLAQACPKIAESQRIEPMLPKLAFLAVCHDRQGKTATASAEYRQVAEAARAAGLVDREAKARELLAKLEPRLSRVTLEFAAAVPGLEVTCDGALVDAARGEPVPLDPGEHNLRVSAPDRRPWETTVRIEGEGTRTVIAVPALARAAAVSAPAPLAPRPVPAADRPEPEPSRLPIYVSGGIGIAGLAVGSYFGIRTFTKQSESDAACAAGCDQAGVDLNDAARTSAYISTAAFAVGVAGVAIATALVLTRPSRSVQLAATVGAGAFGLRGSW